MNKMITTDKGFNTKLIRKLEVSWFQTFSDRADAIALGDRLSNELGNTKGFRTSRRYSIFSTQEGSVCSYVFDLSAGHALSNLESFLDIVLSAQYIDLSMSMSFYGPRISCRVNMFEQVTSRLSKEEIIRRVISELESPENYHASWNDMGFSLRTERLENMRDNIRGITESRLILDRLMSDKFTEDHPDISDSGKELISYAVEKEIRAREEGIDNYRKIIKLFTLFVAAFGEERVIDELMQAASRFRIGDAGPETIDLDKINAFAADI